MIAEKDVVRKMSFGVFPVVGRGGTEVIDDIVIEVVGLVGISPFVNNPRRKMGGDKDYVVVDIATGIGVVDAEDIASVILTDVVTYNNIIILGFGTHPEQAMTVVMAVAVLKDTAWTLQIGIVQAPVVIV